MRHQICEISRERELSAGIGEIEQKPEMNMKEVPMDETIGVFSHKKKRYQKAGVYIGEMQ